MKNVPFWPAEGHGQGGYGLVDFRNYTFKHGKLGEFFKLYKEEGWPVQSKILGNCIGYYQSDIGGLNQILHLWAYKDAADRAARRAALGADPAWKAYLAKASPLLMRMENTLLVNAPFFKP
ncbi:MAG: NIPSNAP family protein [Alphaproteobacteria bacterium]|nr:NIPSNAP family protein [Alphaproteobacteria bacterium]MBN9497036.1 NIPSNAP family protein [Alphaproteobacteria bacterium]